MMRQSKKCNEHLLTLPGYLKCVSLRQRAAKLPPAEIPPVWIFTSIGTASSTADTTESTSTTPAGTGFSGPSQYSGTIMTMSNCSADSDARWKFDREWSTANGFSSWLSKIILPTGNQTIMWQWMWNGMSWGEIVVSLPSSSFGYKLINRRTHTRSPLYVNLLAYSHPKRHRHQAIGVQDKWDLSFYKKLHSKFCNNQQTRWWRTWDNEWNILVE